MPLLTKVVTVLVARVQTDGFCVPQRVVNVVHQDKASATLIVVRGGAAAAVLVLVLLPVAAAVALARQLPHVWMVVMLVCEIATV